MKTNTTKRDNSRESSHNDDISGIKEIQPIDKRYWYQSLYTNKAFKTNRTTT